MKKGDRIKLNFPTIIENILRSGILTVTVVGEKEIWFDGEGFKTKLSKEKVEWCIDNGSFELI